jgi:diketogulonate reductase-like aldo/keto reductase
MVAQNKASVVLFSAKVWTDKIYDGEAAIRAQVDKTLADLNTTYLDLYLIHWPVPGKHVAAYQVSTTTIKRNMISRASNNFL